ncbi:hypothetical protein [Arthrobacter sp. BE255]|uniref:hypothetical protein n=1 Tax=Arthrobacter sp. BE255 TaxID=2817721 RepID=UPI00285BA643|nr:hypothetical protein [Arthrobacter sp. BE255]MDR7159427.1 hypothetical protein [Arthrobacter sp. BE255]
MGKSRREPAAFAGLRTAAAILAGAAVALGLGGCRDVFAPPPCMPPAYTVTPSEVRPGAEVTVRAPDTTCGARYGRDAQVQVTVRDAARAVVLEALAPMTDDGGFTFVFTVPPATAPGEAAVMAYPYNLDWCDDTGVNNRAGAGDRTLVLVSCAERSVPLVVLDGAAP